MVAPELKNKQATGIASDASKGPPDYNLPTASAAGAVDSKDVEKIKLAEAKLAEAKLAEDEDDKFWKIVGWKPRFGDGVDDDTDMTTNLADQQTWLEERLHDKFYGGKTKQLLAFKCADLV